MIETTEDRPPAPINNGQVLFVTKILLMLVTGSLSVLLLGYPKSFPFRLLVTLFLYATASLILRFGWVIPCIILGVLVGLITEPAVGGGGARGAEAMAFRMYFGVACGLAVGSLLERSINYWQPERDAVSLQDVEEDD